MPSCQLPRRILALKGDDVHDWLSGLITNSISDEISFAALLTPQGKILADFFVHVYENSLIVETPEKFGDILLKRLKLYRLRADVIIEDVSASYHVYALWGEQYDKGVQDPRSLGLGRRLLSQDIVETSHQAQDYDLHRMELSIPDSEWDFASGETFAHNVNMDQLSGIDFKKGCFIGQEVVSRMQRKTEVRKRMRAVKLSGAAQSGDMLFQNDRNVGTLKHVRNDIGMALIRLDRLENTGQYITVNGNKAKIIEPKYE